MTPQTPAPSTGEAQVRDQQQGPEDYPTAPEAPAATCACGCPDAYCLTLGEVLIHSADGCRVHLIGGRG